MAMSTRRIDHGRLTKAEPRANLRVTVAVRQAMVVGSNACSDASFESQKNGAHQLCDALLEKFEGSRDLATQPSHDRDLSAGVNPGFTARVETDSGDTECAPAVELPVSVEGSRMKWRRLSAGKIVAKLRDYAFDRTDLWKKSFPAGLDVPKLESFDPIDVSFEADKTGRFSGHASIIVSKTVRMAGQDQIGSASYNARVTGHIDGQSVIVDDLTLTSDR